MEGIGRPSCSTVVSVTIKSLQQVYFLSGLIDSADSRLLCYVKHFANVKMHFAW